MPMSVEFAIHVNGTKKASLAIPPRWQRYLLSDHRIGAGAKKTEAEKAQAALTWIVDRLGVRDAEDNPGTPFGDWIRKRIGHARGLGRDLTAAEFRQDGATALLAELDTTDPTEDAAIETGGAA